MLLTVDGEEATQNLTDLAFKWYFWWKMDKYTSLLASACIISSIFGHFWSLMAINHFDRLSLMHEDRVRSETSQNMVQVASDRVPRHISIILMVSNLEEWKLGQIHPLNLINGMSEIYTSYGQNKGHFRIQLVGSIPFFAHVTHKLRLSMINSSDCGYPARVNTIGYG